MELLNGTGPHVAPCLIDTSDLEAPQKTKNNGTAASCSRCLF